MDIFLKSLTLTIFLGLLVGGHEGVFGQLPTVYEYYTEGGIQSGLTADSDGFILNGKAIRIYSGSLHYFRVHPDYWRDRLRRFRAAGLNTVDTYVPWNLHEPRMGHFDFGSGQNDLSALLDLVTFIKMAQEEDLLVIFRPGPYICTEWDYGGLPSWLLRDPELKVRSSNAKYEERVKIYFEQLLPLVKDLQWSKGGPIIATQIENEYGAFIGQLPTDLPHLEFIKKTMEDNGLEGLFFTSDSPLTARDNGALPGVLQTANFQNNAEMQLNVLLELQPNRPIFIAEFWSGWYTHWMEPASVITDEEMAIQLEKIFGMYNGSVNFYMFHGGTNFGFMSGANDVPYLPQLPYYAPDVTSYDYNAPISENGDYDPKYFKAIELMEKYAEVKFWTPEIPPQIPSTAYPDILHQFYLSWNDLVEQIPQDAKFYYENSEVPSMEELDMNDGSGQSYGYIVYRIGPMSIGNGTKITIGKSRDLTNVIVDQSTRNPPLLSLLDIIDGFGCWTRLTQSYTLTDVAETSVQTLDLVTENLGRVNFGGPGAFVTRKGLQEGRILIDDVEVTQMQVFAAEFKSSWVKGLKNFHLVDGSTSLKGPIMLRSSFNIAGVPQDTFLDMSGWTKGLVYINGFNLGRYWKAGPQQTLFVPAPLLNQGLNTINIFEMYQASDRVTFTDRPDLGVPDNSIKN